MLIRRAFSTVKSFKNARIAIIGSGPAGLYTCTGLVSRLPECIIDVFDQSAIPYGLVQYGVAPDHYDVKRCANHFEKLFTENSDRLSLFCNVNIGKDLTFDELCQDYDAVVLAYGANKPRRLNIPGSDAINCISGGDFVSWYNGASSTFLPLLDDENAVIIGNGNVALDCSRILLISIEKLAQTDIPENALKILRQSKVKNINIFGRRGPREASFTIKELRELLNLDQCSSSTNITDEEAEEITKLIPTLERPSKRILQLMLDRRQPKNVNAPMKCTINFHHKPIEVEKDSKNRIKGVQMEHSITKKSLYVPCGLLIYAIGYENVILPGLESSGNKLLMKDWCRVPNEKSKVYATGWCAHSPSGVIASTQSEAVAVADEIAKDFAQHSLQKEKENKGSQWRLDDRNVPYLTFNDWKYVDECEKTMGKILGKLREKIQNVSEFINFSRR
uniref:NADPH:adrenodoxin oxidoreductase, mitochondrial n=1 Tax=Panagrolaimus sp. PS1159 TaxID=55785 RepID=A0AC35GEU4_9BILA